MYPKEGRKREAFSPASLFHRDENDKKEGGGGEVCAAGLFGLLIARRRGLIPYRRLPPPTEGQEIRPT